MLLIIVIVALLSIDNNFSTQWKKITKSHPYYILVYEGKEIILLLPFKKNLTFISRNRIEKSE